MKNKLLLCFLLTIMIFPIMVNAKEGLQVENGKTYYYENDVIPSQAKFNIFFNGYLDSPANLSFLS